VNPNEVLIWRVRVDEIHESALPNPTPGELARAARFHSDEARTRYVRAHGALRSILQRYTGASLDFAVNERSKPYLPNAAHLKFNLSRSRGMALVGVALDVEIGVDIERIRPLPELESIAERFFPPSEFGALKETPASEREREFFRRWTLIEARLKAHGVGLYGAGMEFLGEWTLQEIDVDEGYAAAVAAVKAGMKIAVRDF
jgi:4'-phosphopantetheinyl transferase